MNALIGLENGGHLLAAFAGCEVNFAKWDGIEDSPEVQRTIISGPTVTIPVPSEELLYVFSTYLSCYYSPCSRSVEVPKKRQEYRYTLASLSRERNAKPWQRSREQ